MSTGFRVLTPRYLRMLLGADDGVAPNVAKMLVYAQFYLGCEGTIIHLGRWRICGTSLSMWRYVMRHCMETLEKETLQPCSHL